MKIPVGKTLEAAFSFGLKKFFSVLGTVWFPLLVCFALIGGAAYLSFSGLHGDLPDPKLDPVGFMHAAMHFSGLIGVVWIAFLVTGAMIQVGLLRKALDLHHGPVFIFYSLGPDVWRMLGAMLLLFVIFMGLVIGAIAAGLAVFFFARSFIPEPGSYWVDGVTFFALFCAYIYAAVRLSYFVPVVVVAEGHIGISRAWELGRGNFWRIFAIAFVISLAVNIVASMVTSIFMPPFMMDFDHQTDPVMVWHEYAHYMLSVGPVFAIVTFFQYTLLYGFMAGAAAYAYRSVTQPPAPEGMQSA